MMTTNQPSFLCLYREEVLNEEHKHNMSSASEVKCAHSYPQTSDSFSRSRLTINYLILVFFQQKPYLQHTIENVLIRHKAIRTLFHFLYFGFAIIKRQGRKCRESPCDQRAP